MMDIKAIRAMIESGLSDDEIEEQLLESKVADEEHLKRYGDEREDERTTAEKEMSDRLDMGRNDAGEWLGFM